jgi:hypothetical protein
LRDGLRQLIGAQARPFGEVSLNTGWLKLLF